MAERYNFKYLPLVGKLPGKSMVEQTESAINELASVVYDNVGYVGNLAEEVQTANNNASNALEKATEALETSGRVYIKLIAAVDVNDYYDSELYYINNDGSTNIPVRDRGFLEVKTNDDKTACEQVFIADSTGTPYYRHGVITEQTLGEETTYVVTWGSWYQGATTEYVQAELQDYVTLNNLEAELQDYVTLNNLEAELQDYLPLSGGTMTGNIIFGNNEAYIQKQNTDIVNRNQLEIGWGRPETAGGGEWFLDGAKMAFHKYDANNSSYDNGGFVISATDGTNRPQFSGYPDGRLTWGDKDIAINAIGTKYIRYNNGIQICWGGNNGSDIPQTITYPVPFTEFPAIGIQDGEYMATSWQYTGFSLAMATGHTKPSAVYFRYIAIGRWK